MKGGMLIICLAVFSKSYCPYCNATKALLDDAGAKYYVVELDQVGMFTPPPEIQLVQRADYRVQPTAPLSRMLSLS